jgi:UDP-N-acetylglucosamine 2-epimerase (non-hydrolysing)
MAPIIDHLIDHNSLKSVVCVTAQHREMLDQVLDIFSIKPDFDLDIMKKNQSLYDITANVMLSIKTVIDKVQPDMIIVQGDTTTTFISALAGFYQQIPVAHVEAGLRSFKKYSPFPEETNRILTTHIADLHFAPTQFAYDNLINEGINKEKISITGNTVIDSLVYITKKLKLQRTSSENKRHILVTGHRRENFGEKFEQMCYALKEIALNYKDVKITYPVHLNPNVQKPVYDILSGVNNIKLIPPVDYIEFVKLMHSSYLVLTDSGGVQEEAPTFGIPVLVMRENTERPEGVQAGVAKLVGTNREVIVNEAASLLDDKEKYASISKIANPYGDGKTGGRIVKLVEEYFEM